VGVLWSLVWAQLRHHRGRWLLLVVGIALVVAVPITSAGLASQVRVDSISRTVHDLAPADRALFVSVEGNEARVTTARADDAIRTQLARLGNKPVRRQMAFRQLTVKGQSFFLGAADSLSTGVHLTSGRLPRQCTPADCEVVVLGRSSAALTRAAATLGVRVVGTAVRTDPRLLAGQFQTGTSPVLAGSSAVAMARLKSLELFSRFFSWTADIDTARLAALGVPAWLSRSGAVDDALDRAVGNAVFVRPGDALQAADNRAQTSTRRFQLLGGLAAALLLGFAIVAACGLRREVALLISALRRRGAVAGQLAAVVAGQAVLAVLSGVIAGGVLGAVAVGVIADAATIGSALSGSRVAVVVLAATAAIVVTAVLLWPDARARALWRMLDLVALLSLGAAVLASDRGSSNLASGGDPLVITLPVLVAVISGLVAARLWAPVSRLIARLLPSRSVAGRIGLLGLIRRPLRPAATVAFLTAAIASVVFAGAYRATLLAGAADQAAFQVPLDSIVAVGPGGDLPGVQVADRPDAHPVLRIPAAVTELPGVVESVPMLGLDSGVLPVVHRWSRVTGSALSATTVADRLRPTAAVIGPAIPHGTRTLSVAASGIDKRTVVTAYLAARDGRELPVALHAAADRLTGSVPSSVGTLHVAAVTISERTDYLNRELHAIGEGRTDLPNVRGTLALGALEADGRAIATDWSTFTSARGTTTATAGRLQLAYNVTGQPFVAVPGGPLAVPVVADAATAKLAHGGELQATLDGTVHVTLRIVAVMARMPTMGSTFFVADRLSLARALDRAEPGRNAVEFWINGSSGSLPGLSVTRRAAVEHDLSTDPVSVGARSLLIVVALLALAVAAVALVLLVIGERRDGAGELYAWEADGTRPGTLRRMLVVRLLIVALVAVPVGVVAGLILARVGTTLVAVDAAGTTPTPPLSVTLGSIWTPLALVVGIGAGVVLGWLVAASSLRERFPTTAEADLR
jgi:hypothetical protein